MRNIGHVFLREYLQTVRTKAFIIITILTPLIFTIVFGLPIQVAGRGASQQRVAVAERARSEAALFPLMREQLERRTDNFRQLFLLEAVPIEPGREAEARTRLRADVVAGRLGAYIWIEGDPLGNGRVDYHGRTTTDLAGIRVLESSVSRAVVQRRLEQRGIAGADVQELVRPTRLRTVRVSRDGEREDRGMTFIMSMFFLMVLYSTLIIYGVMVMRSVIEEKSSRIYEVLLSAAKPIELLAGKVTGVAAVGLTQYTAWSLLFLIAGGGLGLAALRTQIGDFAVPPHVLVFFVVFFLLGFLLYSAMYAALGSMVNSEQETQHFQILILQFLIVPVLLATMILRNPNGTASTVLSLIPFFTPTLMFLRITIVTPPAWEIALSIVVLLATTAGMMWMAARIYRVGILMYGKRPTLPELWRWIKAA